MLINFFFELRKAGLPVSLTEHLTLMEALDRRLVSFSIDDFYHLARLTLIKDESQFDKFDRVFGSYFKGIQEVTEGLEADIPEEWLRRQAELMLSDEEKEKIEALGGWDKLMEELKKRLEEQTERHEGGNQWIGTGGTSPYGAYGYNPEGIRIGQNESRNRRAVKVWDKREFRNLDDDQELGTRNIKMALRYLRRFAREGADDVLDMDDTIDSTARNAGYLDLRMVPEKHNAVKVLLFFDVGGSMEDHVRVCEQLFSAARMEFKHMEYYYFHNFIYESVWRDSRMRRTETIPTYELMRTFTSDYKLIFVGDATMSPYEIVYPGGSVEHWNEEAGAVWMQRLLDAFPSAIWLNPEPQERWEYTPSIRITDELLESRMFPLTVQGLEQGIRTLGG